MWDNIQQQKMKQCHAQICHTVSWTGMFTTDVQIHIN